MAGCESGQPSFLRARSNHPSLQRAWLLNGAGALVVAAPRAGSGSGWLSFLKAKKQPPIVAESMAAEWSSSTGLRSPQSWVRVRAGVTPEGLKIMASHLPFPLGQQGQMTWLLCHPWITVWLLSMAGTALGLWRNVRRHKGQGRRQTASSFMATGYWKKRSLRYYRLLCRLKTANGVMLRCLRRVSDQRQKVIEYKHLKEKARVNDKKRSACPSSPCNSSQHVSQPIDNIKGSGPPRLV
ncbi:uncharacterized protein LOC115612217 [Strigops habroptila]|uniref:uncharacterized protein LOC115612217 n=1 Tax=Strigops habroptila TaxID=2489341 RepID=UPI0011CFF68B|nr:uncharacterized protein LOC115612217 [Strigops habroptila]